jgi:MFS family permease
MSDTEIIGAYIFYNLVFALTAYSVGILADRLGLKRTLLFGLLLFALVYRGMGWNQKKIEWLNGFIVEWLNY